MLTKKCGKCINSRIRVSEGGVFYICTLSPKKSTDCMFGKKDSFTENPMRKGNIDGVSQ